MDKHPDCEDRCQLREHKGYIDCQLTGNCAWLTADSSVAERALYKGLVAGSIPARPTCAAIFGSTKALPPASTLQDGLNPAGEGQATPTGSLGVAGLVVRGSPDVDLGR